MELATVTFVMETNPTVGASLGMGMQVPTPCRSDVHRTTGRDPSTVRAELTEREKRILRLICDGLTNAEIALRLGLSTATVKAELTRLFRKIDVKNRSQAASLIARERSR